MQDLVQDVLKTFVRLHLVYFESTGKRKPLLWCCNFPSYMCSFETVVYNAVVKDIKKFKPKNVVDIYMKC